MQRLRRQVDRIDLKLLKLLQQRTRLSGEIGRTKRRHGAEIYVPGRERELLARVIALAGGALPACAVKAIFREILSSSRAAQGQAPIGVLRGSEGTVLSPARNHFGACDQFISRRSWREMAKSLEAGELAIALLTLADLTAILLDARTRKYFLDSISIVGEFSADVERSGGLDERVFIVKPRGTGMPGKGGRALILIECKDTAYAVKSLLTSMSQPPIHSEHVALNSSRKGKGATLRLLGVTLARERTGKGEGHFVISSRPGLTTSILGIYPDGEDYGG